MFEGVTFAVRLAWLQRTRRKWRRRYTKRLSGIRITPAGAAKREEILQDMQVDLGDCDGEIAELQTAYLIDRAERYGLLTPERAEGQSWDQTQGSMPYWHLTAEAMIKLRAEIRAEQKERWSVRLLWLPLLTALTGIIGTLIGLFAILKK